MSIKAAVSTAVKRYGSDVFILREEEKIKVKAFIEPMRRRHRPYINEKLLPAGYFNNNYRLYIGESRYPLHQTDTLILNDESFSVVMSEGFVVQNENLYVWAILEKKAEMPEDDYDDQ